MVTSSWAVAIQTGVHTRGANSSASAEQPIDPRSNSVTHTCSRGTPGLFRPYQLVYFSVATRLPTERDLLELLAVSRRSNTQTGITGLLLYRAGSYMQLLEGERKAVTECFWRIQRDGRHQDVKVLLSQESEERIYSDWSMGFCDPSNPSIRAMEGFSPFLLHRPDPGTAKRVRGAPIVLMETFLGL